MRTDETLQTETSASPRWFDEFRAELRRYARQQAAILEAEVLEELLIANAKVPPAAGGTVVDGWQPQISQTQVVTGLLVVTQALAGPVTASGVTLTLGRYVFPIQNTTELLAPLAIKVNDNARSLSATYPAGAWTQGALVLVWGISAPSTNAPGVVH